MKTFVTGASGHLGVALVHELVRRGHEVGVLLRPTSTRTPLAGVLPRLALIEGDMQNVEEFASALCQFAPEVVFHLAWFGVANRFKNDSRQITKNLYGSLQLIEASATAGARTFVGLGSQAEYGRVNGRLTENLPLQPETTYGVVKAAVGSVGERLADSLGLRFVWMRLLATYGPYDDAQHLIPFVTAELLAGRVPQLTAGEQVWDYLYVEDAARALCEVALHEEARGMLNLGSGKGYKVASIITRLRDLIDPALPLGLGLKPYAEDQMMHLEADISRLTSLTGWLPTTSLEDGLARTVTWYRATLNASQGAPTI